MWDQVQAALNESATRVLTGTVALLPGVLALAIAVVVSAFFAWIAGFLVRRGLRSVGFDERFAQWGFSPLMNRSSSKSPTLLLSRAISWFIVFLGFLIGVTAFDATLTAQLVMRLFAYLPNVFAALLLLAGGHIVARYLARGILIGAVNMNLHFARLLSVGMKWLVLVLTLAMALDQLGIGGRIVHLAFGILFGGIVLALALAVGLGSKDVVTRSLENQIRKTREEPEETLRHL